MIFRKLAFRQTAAAIFFIAAYAHSTGAAAQNASEASAALPESSAAPNSPPSATASASLSAPPAWGLHAQSTYIWQSKPAFSAAYSGPNSLVPGKDKSYSFTATGDLGLRLWSGAQLHFNPEAARGEPLSKLTGAGGLSNGELARGGSSVLKTYRARLFVQQRVDAGGPQEAVEAGFNELGGHAAEQRWTFTLGNFALLDFFDANPYAKDPRTQFMSWAYLTYGAWDYAADARGYTMGAVAEYRAPHWALRAGRAMQPQQSNGLALDRNIGVHYGDQVELEGNLPWAVAAGPLRARALLFSNRIRAGSFSDALALGQATNTTPDLGLVRRNQLKTGWGLTLEAPLGEDAGVFVRASGNNGKLETYAFTEIDQQLSLGAQFTGARWGRALDRVGVAYAINGLSGSHRDYLAAGGLGFFLGDGKLNYASERVLETYYSWALPAWRMRAGKLESAISVGAQFISNPGYNRDRGPVQTYSVRLHTEF